MRLSSARSACTFGFYVINANNAVPEFRKTNGSDQANIARSDNGNSHLRIFDHVHSSEFSHISTVLLFSLIYHDSV